ncbi:uncharacterized protein L3040_002987 [Drepanopeziza brunnea f. sp. 'multigermtubi']|uniref:C3H1-type domain-containing protein n=1 Tax=Marssonina brunnea f. sp. multigermtubi (strain MB_m1) TaxID=1072389 RepID=K1W7V3_MARBU|nr:uncharacterized protein MBM_08628 [Drepanopeziza brunnea f. sp. 'multigermtubi' MB_m1]EKD13185.1 hypothetical protein MBM_08628 [Drepanopeziza brunnea f. sp. 'multigermtubi' MB_m1]KAJ5047145.1 hypothetical protein L3040_002987 [Drepanopeziza brunnea f. sp. 'multigermtubi']
MEELYAAETPPRSRSPVLTESAPLRPRSKSTDTKIPCGSSIFLNSTLSALGETDRQTFEPISAPKGQKPEANFQETSKGSELGYKDSSATIDDLSHEPASLLSSHQQAKDAADAAAGESESIKLLTQERDMLRDELKSVTDDLKNVQLDLRVARGRYEAMFRASAARQKHLYGVFEQLHNVATSGPIQLVPNPASLSLQALKWGPISVSMENWLAEPMRGSEEPVVPLSMTAKESSGTDGSFFSAEDIFGKELDPNAQAFLPSSLSPGKRTQSLKKGSRTAERKRRGAAKFTLSRPKLSPSKLSPQLSFNYSSAASDTSLIPYCPNPTVRSEDQPGGGHQGRHEPGRHEPGGHQYGEHQHGNMTPYSTKEQEPVKSFPKHYFSTSPIRGPAQISNTGSFSNQSLPWQLQEQTEDPSENKSRKKSGKQQPRPKKGGKHHKPTSQATYQPRYEPVYVYQPKSKPSWQQKMQQNQPSQKKSLASYAHDGQANPQPAPQAQWVPQTAFPTLPQQQPFPRLIQVPHPGLFVPYTAPISPSAVLDLLPARWRGVCPHSMLSNSTGCPLKARCRLLHLCEAYSNPHGSGCYYVWGNCPFLHEFKVCSDAIAAPHGCPLEETLVPRRSKEHYKHASQEEEEFTKARTLHMRSTVHRSGVGREEWNLRVVVASLREAHDAGIYNGLY